MRLYGSVVERALGKCYGIPKSARSRVQFPVEALKGFYFITGSELSRKGNIEDVKAALSAGVSIIQYRNKKADTRQMYKEALEIRKLTKGKALLIINDRLDIAMAVDADGVHLGQEDLQIETARKLLGMKIIGVSTHSVEQAVSAEKAGADYIGVGPLFATATKEGAGRGTGITFLKEIRKTCKLPIVAIGGITLENVKSVMEAKPDMIAAISATVGKEDPKGEMLKFQALFRQR